MTCLKRKKPTTLQGCLTETALLGKAHFHCVEDYMERPCALTFLYHRK